VRQFIDSAPDLAMLLLALATILACFLGMGVRRHGSTPGLRNRLGLLGDIDERLGRAFLEYVGARFVAGGRASLNFASIAAGLQERLTITVAGALVGDYAQAAPETDIEAGLAFAAHVSAADTVTVTMVNNTAGAIDPAANVFRVRVTREAKR
jgi:hypothetical protein